MKSIALTLLGAAIACAQTNTSVFPLFPPMVSTVPSNGDVNPYGVAFAPKTIPSTGILKPGDILVSNYNNSENLQGLGTTITRIDKWGRASTFFTAAVNRSGISAALGILADGLVLAGNLPTADGTFATAQPGMLSVLDNNGNYLGTFGDPASIDGPWGMALYDTGTAAGGTAHAFVSNVLSGAISRIDITYTPTQISATRAIIATGFNHRPDPAALELGPSGLAYDSLHDVLYVASSADNAIYEIANALSLNSPVSPTLFVQDLTHLHGPLNIAFLPNGHLVVANSDGSNVDPNQPSELVEYSSAGTFLGQQSIDPNNGGAFGFAINNIGWGTFQLAAVDDNTNMLRSWTAVAH